MRGRLIPVAILVLLLALVGSGFYFQRAAVRQALFDLTGEEALVSQARAVGQLALQTVTRAPLNLQPEAPIRYSEVNPFGVNTFLQQEVEPAKRERQVQLIAAAGFHWLRQEFPWADIEIAGKNNFQDCRNNGQCISAWDKYDQIVSLAAQSHLEIIARLSSPPNWSRAEGNARGDFAPPDRFADYADYAAAVATRYQGRVRYFQIWNEPNANNEWGYQPVDPEAYTRLLCETYARLKAVDPQNVVLAAALSPTNDLGGQNPDGLGGNNLSDLVYLERMYQAGARGCFDIMSVQGYGLWSGPTDHRLNALDINIGRNQYIRDLMVAHGDADKAVWISEMNWNTVPKDSGIPPNYGQVTEEQQARYVPLAYARAQQEWPWVGVINLWYFKDATDAEKNQPKYYFRLADPDFTLKPVYYSVKDYTHQLAVMYPGWHAAPHWAVQWDGNWRAGETPDTRRATAPGATAWWVFAGTELELRALRPASDSRLRVRVDQGAWRLIELRATDPALISLQIAQGLTDGQHLVELVSEAGEPVIDSFIVRRNPNRTGWLLLGGVLVLAAAGWLIRRR